LSPPPPPVIYGSPPPPTPVYEGPLPPITGVSYASPPPPPFYWFFWEFPISNLPSNKERNTMDFVIRVSFFLLWAILVALLEKIEKESGQFTWLNHLLQMVSVRFIALLLLIIVKELKQRRQFREVRGEIVSIFIWIVMEYLSCEIKMAEKDQ
jgi:hypothetical protein